MTSYGVIHKEPYLFYTCKSTSYFRLRITHTHTRCCIQNFPGWVITKYALTTINTRWQATQRVMAVKLTRLTHNIAIHLYLVAESCFICSSRSRRPVRKLLDTVSYLGLGPVIQFCMVSDKKPGKVAQSVMWLTIGWKTGVWLVAGAMISILATASKWALGSTQPHKQWVEGGGDLSLWWKRNVHQTDYSSSSSASNPPPPIRLRGCIQKFPDWVDNEIYAYNNKHSLRSNTKGYVGKTH
jgi:hypothetical protein